MYTIFKGLVKKRILTRGLRVAIFGFESNIEYLNSTIWIFESNIEYLKWPKILSNSVRVMKKYFRPPSSCFSKCSQIQLFFFFVVSWKLSSSLSLSSGSLLIAYRQLFEDSQISLDLWLNSEYWSQNANLDKLQHASRVKYEVWPASILAENTSSRK